MAGLTHRIHLDPIGGIAGDMFVAALADAFPELIPGLLAEIEKLPVPTGAKIGVVAHRDAVLTGRRFEVAEPASARHHHSGHPHHHDHDHSERSDVVRRTNELCSRNVSTPAV